MKVIGFNLSKISGHKSQNFSSKPILSTNIKFIEIEKEEVAMISAEALKVEFSYAITYEKNTKEKEKEGEVEMQGNLILSVTSEESKEILKNWKKKSLPEQFKIPLFNVILKKCTPKAVQYEDELNLPLHIPVQRLVQETKQ